MSCISKGSDCDMRGGKKLHFETLAWVRVKMRSVPHGGSALRRFPFCLEKIIPLSPGERGIIIRRRAMWWERNLIG